MIKALGVVAVTMVLGAGGAYAGDGNGVKNYGNSGNKNNIHNEGDLILKGGTGGTGGTGVGVGIGGNGGTSSAVSGGSQSNATSSSGSGTASSTVSVDVPRQAPPAIAPALSVSSLTCYATAGIGLSSPFGGVSGGWAVKDKGCDQIRKAFTMTQLGFKDVGLMIMLNDPEVKKAMIDLGYLPQEVAVVAPSVQRNDSTSIQGGQ